MSDRGLAINQYLCPPDYGLDRFLGLAARVGAEAVGLTRGGIGSISLTRLRAKLRDLQLEVSSLNSAGYFSTNDADTWRRQSDENLRLVDAAAELEAGTLCVIAGGTEACGGSPEEARAATIDRLAWLDEKAGEAGVRLGLEPIHPAEIFAKGCVNSIAQAETLVSSLHSTGLLIDVYHSWWDPDFARLPQIVDRTVLVQLCGVARRQSDFGFGREPLDQGFIDIATVIRGTREAGYDGAFEFEMFARDLLGRTPDAVVTASASRYAAIHAPAQ